MSDVFRTSDPQLAAALIQTLGPEKYLGLSVGDSGIATFEFSRKESCRTVKNSFYAKGTDDDGFPETLAINDARALLKTAGSLYTSLRTARNAWQKEQKGESR